MILAVQLCILFCLNTAEVKKPVIDSSCDLREVKLPDKWKFECINPETGKLNPGLDAKTRTACLNIAGNNRDLKRKGCISKM